MLYPPPLLVYSGGMTIATILVGPSTLEIARNIGPKFGCFTHEVALKVYRLAGLKPPPVGELPFRAPHFSVSRDGMAGRLESEFFPVPGELSLACGGVLYLDRAHEFRPHVLEAVFEAIRDGHVKVGPLKLPAPERVVFGLPKCACECQECCCTWEQKGLFEATVELLASYGTLYRGEDLENLRKSL